MAVWDRVQLCYKDLWTVEDLFDPKTTDVINHLSQANAFPPGYLIPHLIAAASHCSNKSRVLAWKQQCEPGIFYTSVVGYTATNEQTFSLQLSDSVILMGILAYCQIFTSLLKREYF